MDELRAVYNANFTYYFMLPMAILLLTYFYSCYKLSYWKRRGVQQISNSHILFGDFKNGVLFRTSPGSHLGEIYHRSPSDAPYIGFYIFHKPCLLLKDPEIIKQLLIHEFNNFSNRHFAGPQQRDSLGMMNLFGVRNPAWKYLRQKISPRFTRRKLKQMLSLMVDTGESMMSHLKNNFNTDKERNHIDAQDINQKYAADLFANIALGIQTDSFTYPDCDYTKYFMRFFHSMKRMIALMTVFFMPSIAEIGLGSSVYFDTSLIRRLFWHSIQLREKSETKRGDIIDEIIELKNGDQDLVYRFAGENLFNQVGTFFGLESSSTASAFTLMQLAKHKKYQDLAREDILKAFDKHGSTIDAYNEMKYLDQCILEAVRVHPPVSILDRNTLEDYKIPNTDICIEKGTPVYVSLYGLHHDAKYFDEPEVFDPERFADRIICDAYMPFGIGPRTCVGNKLGVLHVKVVIAMILSEYEVYQRREDVNELDARFTFTAASEGIHLEFTKLRK